MKGIALLSGLLLLSLGLWGLDSRNRFALYGDLEEGRQSLGALWAMDLSQGLDWQGISLQGEYSMYARYQSRWEADHSANMTAESYRAWLSLSLPQSELRLGLQRLNFGSAQILRPLQWFDTLDPLDPHQYTAGVQAALIRQHWLNNANLWLWGIWGDEQPKGNELIGSKEDSPEFGGRAQYPSALGDIGLSYHHRKLEMGLEHRVGLDLRMDYSFGLWIESAVSAYSDAPLLPDYTLSGTVGADYTFGIGNGLALTAEQMLINTAAKGWGGMTNEKLLSALMLSYPLGLLDSVKMVGTIEIKDEDYAVGVIWQRVYDYISWDLSLFSSSQTGSSLQAMINLHP
jgi:hypothetical protein